MFIQFETLLRPGAKVAAAASAANDDCINHVKEKNAMLESRKAP